MAFVYSCCFWFSLRLGGLFISIFSILQAAIFFTMFSIFSAEDNGRKCDQLKMLDDINLIYMKSFISSIVEGPNYDAYIQTIVCLYIIACVLFIYGALKFINMLMFPYIFMELLRLLGLSFFGITGLLILKENTMDIGLLIGMSVVVGFILLAMFYLWICTANLPIVINEMKATEKATLLGKYRNIMKNQKVRNNLLFNEYYRNHGASQNSIQQKGHYTNRHFYRQKTFSMSDEQRRYYY